MSRFALLCLFLLVSDLPRRVSSIAEDEDNDEDEEEEEGSEYEEDYVTETNKPMPSYMKNFTHGIRFRTNTPPEGLEDNLTTIYVEPEFKRFCNECEDYWHENCHHYPHIYDDSRGNVIRTLSPKSAAELYRDSDDEYDDDEYEDDDEYGSEEEEDEEKEHEEKEGEAKEHKGEGEKGGEGEVIKLKKKPEILMKAEEVQAMRERLQKLDAEKGNNTKEHDINAIIRKAMAERKSGLNLTMAPGGVEPSTIDEITTTLEPETIVFSVEHGKTVTMFKDMMDDADAHLDFRINNAMATLPREFAVSQSGLPDLQLGVWSRVDLPKGVVFGPYRGRIDLSNSHEDSEDKEKPNEHVLTVLHPNTRAVLFQVDGRSNTLGNWCRYINAARHESEQNVELFFNPGQPFPFFRTIVDIPKYTELLADFGNDFRKGKYSSLVNVQFRLPLPKPLPKRQFMCSRCNLDQGSPIAIQRHRKLCNATRIKGGRPGGKKDRPKKKKHRTGDTVEEIVQMTTMDKEAYQKLKDRQKNVFYLNQ
uniref:Histone-lysine N-methyltransferase PRDM9 n=1 Tax=Cacopsylla melanoneura TaxID=428564 RepID=A0A8D9EWH3_9HEMI